MIPLYKNIRLYVLLFTVALSGLVYWQTAATTASGGSLLVIRLTEYYALLAVSYLYVVLLIGPVIYLFKKLPWRSQIFRSRRALGVSVAYFAWLHASLAFFGLLGGFPGLGFLDGRYLFAISLSATALLILTAMAATSFDKIIAKLTFKKWKFLHRFVYLAGILIIIHAALLGTHYASPSTSLIAQISLLLLAVLFIIQAPRIDAYLKTKWPNLSAFGPAFLIVLAALVTYAVITLFPGTGLSSLSIHSQHLAATGTATSSPTTPQKRYTVSFTHPAAVSANTNATVGFQIFDADNGSTVQLFSPVYSKLMHLIIVDQSMTYFSHIHPELTDTGFTITTQLPKDGIYHVYADFQPLGASEQQFGFTLPVGTIPSTAPAVPVTDTTLSKTVDGYSVSITTPQQLSATKLIGGQQTLQFTIKHADSGQPVTTLKPYLAAFGHVTLLNEQNFDYFHIHPTTAVITDSNLTSGPTVDFIPFSLYQPLSAGTYRLFAEFNPDSHLITVPFTITIAP